MSHPGTALEQGLEQSKQDPKVFLVRFCLRLQRGLRAGTKPFSGAGGGGRGDTSIQVLPLVLSSRLQPSWTGHPDSQCAMVFSASARQHRLPWPSLCRARARDGRSKNRQDQTLHSRTADSARRWTCGQINGHVVEGSAEKENARREVWVTLQGESRKGFRPGGQLSGVLSCAGGVKGRLLSSA